MIVLDTTVLIYAVGVEHPYREPSRQLIDAVRTARLTATTTVEVIQEFLHVYSRRRTRAEAATLAGDYATLLSPALVTDVRALRAGLDLFLAHERLGAFDAVLAGAAIGAGAGALVSADPAFAGISRLPHVLPDAAGVGALLGAQS
jgi:hypothetical protein